MPRTPPTIVAPLPNDPRVMSLAKSVSLTRREAFAAAAEAWAWMRDHAIDEIVANTAPDSLDAVVDVDGFGDAMFQAGLVGVVNDGLVLPAELRHHERDDRGGPVAAPAAVADEDERTSRRKEQNAAASRRYRKRNRATGSKAKPDSKASWRSLGHVAGHEVRVFDGPHGCYAMVLGATVGGQPFKKLTTGDKAWSLESVRLVDTLPGLLEKWQTVHRKESGAFVPKPIAPVYADFRDEVDRLIAIENVRAAEAKAARHADAADASARHADASSSSAGPSADYDCSAERKSIEGTGLDASSPSADRHADAFSSMSCLSKSSSSHEEDIGDGSRKAAGIDHERERYERLVGIFAQVLGQSPDMIRLWWRNNTDFLRSELRKRRIDPNTGLRIDAGAPDEPAQAQADIDMTTEPTTGDKGVTVNVGARGKGAEFDCSGWELRKALHAQGIPLPSLRAPPAEPVTTAS